MSLETCVVAILGILAGGVINMLADDLPLRRSIRMPRYADGRRRPPLAWLGIGAFLFNLRRLPAPKPASDGVEAASSTGDSKNVPLGWRYPLTEIATALLMLSFYASSREAAAALSIPSLISYAYVALFMLITVIDLEFKRIPFVVVLPLGALAVLDAALVTNSEPQLLSAAIGGMLGFIVFYIVFLGGIVFARFASRLRGEPLTGHAFGFGDVILMSVVGLTVGFPNILVAILVSVFAGAGGAIALLICRFLKTGRYQAFATIPYGPFIVAGAISVMLLNSKLGFALTAG